MGEEDGCGPATRGAPSGVAVDTDDDIGGDGSKPYEYCLFVAGMTVRSQRSISTVRTVCEKYIKGQYNIAIIDVFADPERAETNQVLVTPTLIRHLPSPQRRIVGDFTSEAILALKMEFSE